MTFMEQAIADSLPLWEQAANESFLAQMGTDTLDRALFMDYIIQDSLYLRDYLKAFAMGIFKSESLAQMQMFASVLGFVNDSENQTRLQYLADGGMTDADVEAMAKRPACAAYTQFLINTAMHEQTPEILMAVMPCMLGYAYVFDVLRSRYPAVIDGYYAPLVQDYTSADYQKSCAIWTDYCNRVCEPLDPQRRQTLMRFFRKASEHELYFWQMAGGQS